MADQDRQDHLGQDQVPRIGNPGRAAQRGRLGQELVGAAEGRPGAARVVGGVGGTGGAEPLITVSALTPAGRLRPRQLSASGLATTPPAHLVRGAPPRQKSVVSSATASNHLDELGGQERADA